MNRRLAGTLLIGAAIGAPMVGCSHDGQDIAVARAADAAARGDASAARLVAAARGRLAEHRAEAAIRLAEKAVAAAPNNADARLLLGQSYLAGGRFASAETALRDALTLSWAQPRARFALALAVTGQGRGPEARDLLRGLAGEVPDADRGLALAIAGDRSGGIAVLDGVVRAGTSDARARQNLALALALDGRWAEARGMAMQDTAPDRLGDQIAEWATIAGPGREPRQVAAMLGTEPAIGDPGQPQRLALAVPTAQMPVSLALAAPMPGTPAAPTAPAPVVRLPLTPAVPAMLAAPARMRGIGDAPVAPGPMVAEAPRGGAGTWVVQLGAYSSMRSLGAAWSEASRLSPRVATFAPVRGTTSVSGAVLMRLAVSGLADRAEADALCRQIRGKGGACFVRQTQGDAPMRWAQRAPATGIAAG